MRGGFADRQARDLAFSALDTNKDGKVSKEEFEKNFPQRLSAADANHDGTVTRKEYEDYIAKQAKERADRMFNRMDTAGAGKLDLKQMADNRFDSLDSNHEGALTKDELFPRPRMMARRGRGQWNHRPFPKGQPNQ